MKANAPEKLYFPIDDALETYARKDSDEEIEYTRTDAFIEKAVEYILTHIQDMHILGGSCRMDECIIEDFRNYMKGE